MTNSEKEDLKYNIEFQESSRCFRTEIPNIVIELFQQGKISSIAYILYINLRRTAGEHGESWKGTRILAKECQCSLGAIVNAKRELSSNFDELQGLPLIKITPGNKKEETSDTIIIIDIWKFNHVRFKKNLTCSPSETPVFTQRNTRVHPAKQKKEPIKKEPYKKPPPLSPPKIEKAKKIPKKEEEAFLLILSKFNFSPRQLLELSNFTLEELRKAVEILDTRKNVKVKFNYLKHILNNPSEFSQVLEEQFIQNQLLALKHNEFLKKHLTKEKYEKNIELIKDKFCMYLFNEFGEITSVSCSERKLEKELISDINESEMGAHLKTERKKK